MEKTIYYLSEYNWLKGILVSEGKKNYKIHHPANGFYLAHDKYVAKEKCAFPGESVCVVWETWRGSNGRGGYRVERELYPDLRVPAEQVAYQNVGIQGRVTEDTPPEGVAVVDNNSL